MNREGEPTFRFHQTRHILDLCLCSESIADKINLQIIPQPFLGPSCAFSRDKRMKILTNIEMPKDPTAAIALQQELRKQVRIENDFGTIKTVAGIDVSYDLVTKQSRSVVCLFSYPTLELLESIIAHAPTDFPYVPGLLSFREIPALLEALKLLSVIPNLLMVDGNGKSLTLAVSASPHISAFYLIFLRLVSANPCYAGNMKCRGFTKVTKAISSIKMRKSALSCAARTMSRLFLSHPATVSTTKHRFKSF